MRELTMEEIDCIFGGGSDDRPQCQYVNTGNGGAVVCSCPAGTLIHATTMGGTTVVTCISY